MASRRIRFSLFRGRFRSGCEIYLVVFHNFRYVLLNGFAGHCAENGVEHLLHGLVWGWCAALRIDRRWPYRLRNLTLMDWGLILLLALTAAGSGFGASGHAGAMQGVIGFGVGAAAFFGWKASLYAASEGKTGRVA